MFKINRPLFFSFSVLVFIITCWGVWFSFNGYWGLFRLSDIIIFSWKVGILIFGSPMLFYFSYLGFYMAIKNKPIGMYGTLTNVCGYLFFIGVVISFIASMYISFNFRSYGYELCPKNSWMAPNKYVKKITLCDEW
ncbi:DUF1240 domain-containing protein [Pectobacterium parmentieri]|uniref:DUF1240 domain-containing protein n=1 Tax=Pectobacterium parmentieri TaxID=1905730 RepID=A0A0H3I9L7_PECPM|nr:DUF1240 domain-containing protein [Pectobacterium parmentieri]ACX89385.1 protein of unknown function DUF1240 [Pectobacterium parmentieri WPP163]AFI91852.1 Putative membrane protein [Pectobacterium parmentieri]MBI0469183.1 DUF1240 domain-containing protein [Pectobacterium parmentieri]MBI0491808.1 DUF1240 domain-containing protein [Pectobacterium parmentieri]MBI0555293.1 DUF1240 domain-containing protein [Pectobacterium parmentieri]